MKMGRVKQLTAVMLLGTVALTAACGKRNEGDSSAGQLVEGACVGSEEMSQVFKVSDLGFDVPENGKVISYCESEKGMYGLICIDENGENSWYVADLTKDSEISEMVAIQGGLEGTGTGFEHLEVDEEGNFYVVFGDVTGDLEDAGSLLGGGVLKLSSSGEVLWKAENVIEDEGIFDMAYSKDAGLVAITSNGFALYDKETGKVGELTFQSEDEAPDYSEMSLFALRDGRAAAVMTDESGGYRLYCFDKKSGGFEEVPGAVPENMPLGLELYAGRSKDFLCITPQRILGFDVGGEKEEICNLTESGLMFDAFSFLGEMPDGRLVMDACFSGEDDAELLCLKRTSGEEGQEMEELIIGTDFIDHDIREAVASFNRKNDKCRIVIEKYSSEADSEDFMDVYRDMNLKIVSGYVPDILLLNQHVPYESYIEMGLIEPLDEYIENDEEISGLKYLDNIVNASKRNGKTYMIIPAFGIDTCAASKSFLAGESVTLANYDRVCDERNVKISEMFGYYDRGHEDYFYQHTLGDFIDYARGTCNFDSPEFVSLLEYIGSLQEYDESRDYDSYYRERKSILKPDYFWDFDEYQILKKGWFGGDIVFNGFPGEKEGKSYLIPTMQLAMTSTCKDKEAAWEFLRSLLTKEYQDKIDTAFPVEESAFDAMATAATKTPTYVDDDGEIREGSWIYEEGDIEIEMTALSEEEVTEFSDFIKSVTNVMSEDRTVSDIIFEEAGAYYAGQKTAPEVASIIQSRVSIYLAEGM